MLCDRYCRALYRRVQELMREATSTTESSGGLKLNEKLHEILEAYEFIIKFSESSRNLFAPHAVAYACSTFVVSLHGVSFMFCFVCKTFYRYYLRNVELCEVS